MKMRPVNTYRVLITMHNDEKYELLDYSESPRTPEPNRHGFIPVPVEDGSMTFLSPGQIRDIKIDKVVD